MYLTSTRHQFSPAVPCYNSSKHVKRTTKQQVSVLCYVMVYSASRQVQRFLLIFNSMAYKSNFGWMLRVLPHQRLCD